MQISVDDEFKELFGTGDKIDSSENEFADLFGTGEFVDLFGIGVTGASNEFADSFDIGGTGDLNDSNDEFAELLEGGETIIENEALLLEMDDFLRMYDKHQLRFNRNYPEIAGSRLNQQFPTIPCVMRGKGANATRLQYSIRLDCMHKDCTRQYYLTSKISGNSIDKVHFQVRYSGTIIHTSRGIARELRADRRIEVREELAHCSVSVYLDLQLEKLDKSLRDAGTFRVSSRNQLYGN